MRLFWPHGFRCIWWCSGHGLYPPTLLPWVEPPQDWSKLKERNRG